MTGYVHGYGTPEQERLVEQAVHGRHRLIREAGFSDRAESERKFWWQDEDLSGQANYAADVMESALAQQPGAPDEELRAGAEDLRSLADQPGAGLGWDLHNSTAVR